jgi:hypothetical protein
VRHVACSLEKASGAAKREDTQMVSQTSSITIPVVARLAERRQSLRRESLRDFLGVAVGVAAGALLWVVFLGLVRLPR